MSCPDDTVRRAAARRRAPRPSARRRRRGGAAGRRSRACSRRPPSAWPSSTGRAPSATRTARRARAPSWRGRPCSSRTRTRTFAWGAFASAVIEHLLDESLLKNKEDRRPTLYRGIKTTEPVGSDEGKTVTLSPSYASTSMSESIAQTFAQRGWREGTPYLLHLTNCAIFPQVHMRGRVRYADSDEEEVILPRNSRFRVTDRSVEGGRVRVTMEALPPPVARGHRGAT